MSNAANGPAGPKAEIISHLGAPALAVDGAPLFLNAPYLAKAPYASFAKMRTGIYLIFDHAFEVKPDGTVVTSAVVERLEALFDDEPEALAIVRFFPPAPDWWLDAHPAEAVVYDTPIPPGKHPMRDVSWASDLWLDDACGWITSFCSELHRRYRGRLVGFQFGLGICGENNQVSSADGRWFCGDFSSPMQAWFRRWLTTRHATDQALAEAWSQPEATLQTAEVPARLERLRSDWFTFRDPCRRQVADYYEAFADRVEDMVIRICETIKQATNHEVVTGSHLGAFLDNGLHAYLYEQTAINKVRRALCHPAVDLFTSPASYLHKQPGGDATSMMPVGSYRLHGKLIFQDQDSRTHHVDKQVHTNYHLGRLPANAAETIGVLKRDFGHALIRGYGLWWHAMAPGMYDHPAIGSCLARLTEIGQASLAFPRGVPPDVAMLVDAASPFHQQCANRLLYPMLYHQRQHEWNRSGLAWECYHWQDLFHADFQPHKLYCFLNTFYLAREDIRRIRRFLAGSGATVLWFYAPGIQSPAGLSLDNVAELTGFRLRSVDIEALPRVTITDTDHPYTSFAKANPAQASMGSGPMDNDEREWIVGPIFHVDDDEARVLGEIDCLREPGLAVKEMDGWTSVYLAAPMLHRHFLRAIGQAAGAPACQAGEDVVLRGKSFLMIHAVNSSRQQFQLPGVSCCYDPYSHQEYAMEGETLTLEMTAHHSHLLFLGSAETYQQGLCRARGLRQEPVAHDMAAHLLP